MIFLFFFFFLNIKRFRSNAHVKDYLLRSALAKGLVFCAHELWLSLPESTEPLYTPANVPGTQTHTHIHAHLVVWIRSCFSLQISADSLGWLASALSQMHQNIDFLLVACKKKYQKSTIKLFEKWHFKVESTSPNNNFPQTKVHLEFKICNFWVLVEGNIESTLKVNGHHLKSNKNYMCNRWEEKSKTSRCLWRCNEGQSRYLNHQHHSGHI